MKHISYVVSYILAIVTCSLLVAARSDIVGSSFSCASVTEIPQAECEALVALYINTDGDHWIYRTNWLVTNTPNDWWGITVTAGHVTSIWGSGNNLNGPLPAEIGDLQELTSLTLAGNSLSGNIPSQIGELSKLQVLELTNNRLSGAMPSQLGNLASLQELLLGSNQLSGNIPAELGNLENLVELHISTNYLSSLVRGERCQKNKAVHGPSPCTALFFWKFTPPTLSGEGLGVGVKAS